MDENFTFTIRSDLSAIITNNICKSVFIEMFNTKKVIVGEVYSLPDLDVDIF